MREVTSQSRRDALAIIDLQTVDIVICDGCKVGTDSPRARYLHP
jgi:hypothetical protein